MEVLIKDILEYLDDMEYEYKFTGNKNDTINGFSTLFKYKKNTLTFVSSLNNFIDYKSLFKDREIKVVIIDPTEDIYDCFVNVIQIKNPKSVFFSVIDQFFNNNSNNNLITADKSMYEKRSYISNKAVLGRNVKIGIGCVIEDDVVIDDNTEIHHNVVIRSKSRIGKNCTIYSGTVIGERGFNPLKNPDGTRKMLEHYGGVIIEDNVHIGENCCIVRGAIDDTIIKKGAKLNTRVHVAHNCIIGENTVITAPTHICGSVEIGRNCHIAAQTIRNQCSIGEGATLGLGAVIVKNVEAGQTVIGNPARPLIKK